MSARRGAGWLEQWKAEEPLRLYLWSVAAAVLVGGVGTGLLAETWALAIGAVIAAVLMVGGTAAARAQAFAPATVDGLLDGQHATSYSRGYTAALRTMDRPGPDHVHPDATRELPAQSGPATQPRTALGRCRHVESGRRCTMDVHPDTFGHRLEQRQPVE